MRDSEAIILITTDERKGADSEVGENYMNKCGKNMTDIFVFTLP